ncbi:MAG: hypothetical protein LC105_10320 [Chitinophagales bacterium]|nr:hypothetical protein [Chitinophagales bacterium]MCZ2394242.1 hypothetical protein [Chitinophagales bacterium]
MLKKVSSFITAVVFSLSFAFAQQYNFVVNEVEQTISQGQQTGLEVFIPEAQLKTVQSALAKWTKSNKGKYIASKKSSEIFQDNVLLTSVSENTVDMYTVLTQQKEGIQMRTFVDLGGVFLSSAGHPQAFAAMETILIDFARAQLVSKVDGDINTEAKHLKTLETELKNLGKQNDSYHKDIANNKTNISKQEQAMSKNEVDQKSKEQQISIQQQILLEVRQKRSTMAVGIDKDSQKLLDNQVKNEEKNLKSFESQLNKLKSDYSSSIKSIEKSKSTIAQREQDIIKNEEDQKTKQQQIELQKQIIDAIKTKRSNIK